jgi:molybdopterin-guanine dinucleotide biosynthesis protein A
MDEAEVSSSAPISAVILAGGRSTRLGRDKAFLQVNGRPLIEQIVDKVAQLSDEVIIVANDLDGIFSGLKAATKRHALVVACDMPLLSLSLLRYMRGLAPGYDVVIPRVGTLTEALHAIYSQDCLPFIERQLRAMDLRISHFFTHVRVRYVDQEEIDLFDPGHLSFFNINSQADLARAKEILAQGQGHLQSTTQPSSDDRPQSPGPSLCTTR